MNPQLAAMMGGGGMSSAPTSQTPEEPGDSQELPVPLTALAQPDDQEAMQTPSVGDSVSFQVDATITRIEGDQAFVKPTAINGTPLDNTDKSPTPDDQDAEEGSDLQAQASQMSQ